MAYRGWANYETWLVKYSMDSIERNYWRERAKKLYSEAKAVASLPSLERGTVQAQAALKLMADLKREYENAHPDWGVLWVEMIIAALLKVNWHEIAVSLIHEVDEVDKKRDHAS